MLNRRDLIMGTVASGAVLAASRVAAKEPIRPTPHAVVVGAGVFGSFTALALRSRGWNVTLVDPWGPGNARASSGGETRVIRGVYGADRIYTELAAEAFQRWRAFEKATGRQFLHPTGAIWLVAGALLHQAPFYNNVFRDALQLLPAWLLGMGLCRFRDPVFAALRRRPLRLPLAIALLIAADVAFGNGVRIGSLTPFSTESGWLDLPYLQKALFAVFALERLAAWEAQRVGQRDRLSWILSRLGDLSLGIFFVHMYVLNWLLRPGWLHFAPLPHAGWLPILGFFLVLLAITVALVLAIRRVLGQRSRALIGC